MRVITSDHSSRLTLALLTALLFIAPSGQTNAQSRAFQMAMWADSDRAPGADTDIPVFYDTVGQPDGHGILIRFDLNKPFTADEYKWHRIAAVLFDEPFNHLNRVPCWTADSVALLNDRIQLLARRAAELKAVAPLTRFWVNVTPTQLDWMMRPLGTCPPEPGSPPEEVPDPPYFNQPYIDVVSLDYYNRWFDSYVKPYYDWLDAHRAKPEQQMALIPGTHYRLGKDRPGNQAFLLDGYFAYANNANQNCNLPLGSRGVTGIFDGCRVWIILGWLGPNWTEGKEGSDIYIGERDPTSWEIANAWRTQLALPLRPDLARQVTPAELVPTLLPLLLPDCPALPPDNEDPDQDPDPPSRCAQVPGAPSP